MQFRPALFAMKIRAKILSIIALAATASTALFAQPEPIRLDLRAALERAELANFDVLIGREQLEVARQGAVRARSGLLPQVDLEAGQSRNQAPLPPSPSYDRIRDNFDAVLRAQLSLLDMNRIADNKLAKYSVEIAGYNFEEVIQSVLEGIARAYFTHYRNTRRMEVLQANLERDLVLLDIARNQLEAGVATPIDVTRAEVRVAADELELQVQETLTYESELNIKRILNLDLDRPVVLEGMPEPSSAPLDSATRIGVQEILLDRPDYAAEALTLERSRYARKAAAWESLPALTLSGSWGYGSESWTDDMEEQWSIRLGLNVPIFTGFRIRANKLEADAFIRQQEQVLAQLEQDVGAAFRLAIENLRSRLRQIQIAERRRDLNLRELELARARFQEGVADNRDVVDAQANLAEALDGVVEAAYLYHLGRLNLARVRGDVRYLIANE